ncbi:hypothetical protein H7Y40_01475 [Pedobacter sp.]|nr:hypothetical protein [Candidatus Saccharibacteria bacterium]
MAKKKVIKKSAPTKGGFLKKTVASLSIRRQSFLDRRPHRSLRRTKRRDLPKHVPLPGYFSFTKYVMKTIQLYRKGFAIFLVLYIIVGSLLVGIASQENYKALTDSFGTLGQELIGGNVDTATQTLALFGAAISGGLADPLTEAQQVYLVLLGMFTWLAVVWYLRHRLSGTIVKVRDALYNSGGPFLSSLIIAFFMVVQLVPGAVGILIYSMAASSGIIDGGIESMLFATIALLLCVLSLYWVASSFFAALIVTIPGTYPLVAMKMAGDIVLGRRLSVMLRLLWLGLALLIAWALVLIPAILIAGWINTVWLPIVPVVIQILSAGSVLVGATYIYLLYRKMIDEPVA